MQLAILMEIQGHGCLGAPAGDGLLWSLVVGATSLLLTCTGGYMCLEAREAARRGGWRVTMEMAFKGHVTKLHPRAEAMAAACGVDMTPLDVGEGDEVVVLHPREQRAAPNGYGGWGYGECRGRRGWFPLSFCSSGGEVGKDTEAKRWTWPDRHANSKRVTFSEEGEGWLCGALQRGAQQGVVLWTAVTVLAGAGLGARVGSWGGAAGGWDAVMCAAAAAAAGWGWAGTGWWKGLYVEGRGRKE